MNRGPAHGVGPAVRENPIRFSRRLRSFETGRSRFPPNRRKSGRPSAVRSPGNFGVRSRRSEEHTSELQSRLHLVCRLLLEKKKNQPRTVLNVTNTNTLFFTSRNNSSSTSLL